MLVTTILSFISSIAFAMIPVEKASTVKRDIYKEKGVFIGGKSSDLLALVNIRHTTRRDKKMERLILDLNSMNAEVSSGRPGFFQVTIQKNPRRLLIDLQDVVNARITSHQVTELIKESHFFSKAYFYFDREKKDLTIELPLKNRAQIEVVEQANPESSGSIIIDAMSP